MFHSMNLKIQAVPVVVIAILRLHIVCLSPGRVE